MTNRAWTALRFFSGSVANTAQDLALLTLRIIAGHFHFLRCGYLTGNHPFAITIGTNYFMIFVTATGYPASTSANGTFFFETGQPSHYLFHRNLPHQVKPCCFIPLQQKVHASYHCCHNDTNCADNQRRIIGYHFTRTVARRTDQCVAFLICATATTDNAFFSVTSWTNLAVYKNICHMFHHLNYSRS